MKNERQISPVFSQAETPGNVCCERDVEGHCITCSDEALQVCVLRVDKQSGVAFVTIKAAVEEVDITLIDNVLPGNLLLVHGGVAIANISAEAGEVSDG